MFVEGRRVLRTYECGEDLAAVAGVRRVSRT